LKMSREDSRRLLAARLDRIIGVAKHDTVRT